MVDEDVVGDGQGKPRLAGAKGQVIVVEEARTESFIESADRLVHSPFHEQAEAGELGREEPCAAMAKVPVVGELVHCVEIGVGDVGDKLGGRGIIGHGPDEPDPRVRIVGGFACGSHRQGDELVEPVLGDDGIFIEQDEEFAPGDGECLIDGGGIAAVCGVGNELNWNAPGVGKTREVLGCAVVEPLSMRMISNDGRVWARID